MNGALEREEEAIIEDFNQGRISAKERDRAISDLYRDYQAMAEESAMGAYRDELERW
jgi:hypothetical protein